MKRIPALISVVGLLIAGGCATHPKALTSEVNVQNGMPALFVDGKLTSTLTFWVKDPKDVQPFIKAGIRIADFSLPFGWTGPEKYDFTKTDEVMDGYLRSDANLLALPRFSIQPGPWWCQEFPNEITLRADGTPAVFRAPCHPSFASTKYRELAHRALQAFLTHVESKYGDRVVGYFPGNGIYGEWFSWNAYWEAQPGTAPPTKFGVEDYSEPARTAFQQWLRKKYQGSEDALRRAWGQSQATFESAAVPPEEARRRPTHGIFFDPTIGAQVPDYFEFFNDLISDVLIEQCRWTKQAIGGHKVVGAFYGYLWTNYPHLSLNHSGHLRFHKVLHTPEIDFIAGPHTYDNRGVGGADTAQTLPDSIAMHGKLYFNEVDTETHLHQRQWRWGDSLRNPRNFEETQGLLVRDFAYAFTKNFGMWYMELLGGTYNDPEIIGLLSRVRQVDQKYLAADKRSSADIAVVLDEDSYRYLGDGEVFLTALVSAQKQWELNYIGAPYDTYLAADLGDPAMRDYKLYLFLNTFRVSPQQRAAIQQRLKRNHATAIWVYAPGYIDEKLSLENIQALTGIRLAEDPSAGELHVTLTSSDHPYTSALPRGLEYGTDVNVANIKQYFDHRLYLKDPTDPSLRRDLPGFRVQPRFYGDDPKATALGKLAGLNRPGLLVKEQDGWTSVYSSAPILPAALLRSIAQAAGCHMYTDAGDVVYADRNFLAIYSPNGGKRLVHLPHASRVLDLLEGRTLAEGASEFSIEMPANTARVFALQ
jgi:hypothetical protein